jgi:hypothetical protein
VRAIKDQELAAAKDAVKAPELASVPVAELAGV